MFESIRMLLGLGPSKRSLREAGQMIDQKVQEQQVRDAGVRELPSKRYPGEPLDHYVHRMKLAIQVLQREQR